MIWLFLKEVSHVEVYLKDGYFVDASTKKSIMIIHLDEKYLKKLITGHAESRNKCCTAFFDFQFLNHKS